MSSDVWARFEGATMTIVTPERSTTVPGIGVVVTAAGLALSGPKPGQLTEVLWKTVRSLGPGLPERPVSGTPVNVMEVALFDGRSLRFLVSPSQLSGAVLGVLQAVAAVAISQAGVSRMTTLALGAGAPVQKGSGRSGEKRNGRRPAAGGDSDRKTLEVFGRPVPLLYFVAVVAALLLGTGGIAWAMTTHQTPAPTPGPIVHESVPTTTAAPGGASQTTSSTEALHPVGQLLGPAAGASVTSVASPINLTSTDLPSGWATAGAGGPGVAPGSSGSSSNAAVQNFATCLGLPVTAVAPALAVDVPAEPPAEASPLFSPAAPSPPAAGTAAPTGPTAPSVATEVGSSVTLEPSLQAAQTAMAAFASDKLLTCLQTAAAALAPGQTTGAVVSDPVATVLTLPSQSGVTAVGVSVSLTLTSTSGAGSASTTVVEQLALLGAGRLVSVVHSLATQAAPLPSGLFGSLVGAVEQRTAAAAA